MLAWHEPESRDVALLAMLRVAQDFLGLAAIEDIEVVSAPCALRVSAKTIPEFLRLVPQVLNYDYCRCVFALSLNGSPTGFELGHLDQSLAGAYLRLVGDCIDLQRERLFAILERVLKNIAQENPEVDCETGSWFDRV